MRRALRLRRDLLALAPKRPAFDPLPPEDHVEGWRAQRAAELLALRELVAREGLQLDSRRADAAERALARGLSATAATALAAELAGVDARDLRRHVAARREPHVATAGSDRQPRARRK